MVAPGKPAYLVRNISGEARGPRGLYTIPHGTGNSMSEPGDVRFDEGRKVFFVERGERIAIYDKASDIFDTYPGGTEVLKNDFMGGLTQVDRLLPFMEIKLRSTRQYPEV
jgi:hypothetical protein